MNLNNIDLNKIAVFCQVVDSRNYRLASEVLHVTPSAISQTISLLEETLGFSLFHRSGRNLLPTQNGLKLHAEFRRHHGNFLESLRGLARNQEEVVGALRIGAYLEFAKSQLAPVVSKFLRRYPNTQLKLSFDMPSRLQRNLEQGQIDICFSIYPSIEKRKVESIPVYNDELVLICPTHILPESPSFADILKAPIVEYYANHQPILRWIELHYRKRLRQVPVRVYASTAEMVFSLVKEGVGMGVIPKFLYDSKTSDPNIRLIRPGTKKLLDHIWMLELKAKKSPLHAEFRREVLSHLKLHI